MMAVERVTAVKLLSNTVTEFRKIYDYRYQPLLVWHPIKPHLAEAGEASWIQAMHLYPF